jgi:hypothetical protein
MVNLILLNGSSPVDVFAAMAEVFQHQAPGSQQQPQQQQQQQAPTDAPKSPKFETQRMADVCTSYLAPSDLKLIGKEDCPMRVAEVDGHYGTIFLVPTEELDERLDDAEQFGLSARFVHIISELAEQKISYVRFDADGDAVDGLEPLTHE